MKQKLNIFAIIIFLLTTSNSFAQKNISEWLTKGDSSVVFKQQASISFSSTQAATTVITVDDSKTFQSIDGFGFALTQGSALALIKMNADKRAQLLKELFDTKDDHIGVSYIRL